jgi:ATP-binding cassette, subfamily C (CFTR/MRP), member 1
MPTATIVNFDLILVMDKGQIIECGTPEELLARQSSQFRRLAESQGLVDREHAREEELDEITEAL